MVIAAFLPHGGLGIGTTPYIRHRVVYGIRGPSFHLPDKRAEYYPLGRVKYKMNVVGHDDVAKYLDIVIGTQGINAIQQNANGSLVIQIWMPAIT